MCVACSGNKFNPQDSSDIFQHSNPHTINRETNLDSIKDKYLRAFLLSKFETIDSSANQNAKSQPSQNQSSSDVPEPEINSSHLVSVEIWNTIIGDEKNRILNNAKLLGSPILPDQKDWGNWQLATGKVDGESKKILTFLIPPDFEKITSGTNVIIEITSQGGIHIARYILKL